MKQLLEIIFWMGLAVIFYAYIGYGLFLLIYTSFTKRKKYYSENNFPAVTLIVAAYNEEDFIEEKIKNSLQLDYPTHLLQFIFITDGSTDQTPAIVKNYPQITLMHQPERRGKVAALNRAMEFVKTPFVVFSDANALLNKEAIRKIVRHYGDEKTGGVAGEKRVVHQVNETALTIGESIYWKYESFLKNLDSKFNTVVGAAGEIFSIRTELFKPMDENILSDDLLISLHVCQQGYRFAYEPEAFSTESISLSIEEERKRKIRIGAGCYQAIKHLISLLNPTKNSRLFFQYFSHRFLRWTACPLFLPIIFLVNIFLLFYGQEAIYQLTFLAQCLFYLIAAIGWMFAKQQRITGILLIPYYFVFMNISLWQGFFRFIKNNQLVTWEKAIRKKQN